MEVGLIDIVDFEEWLKKRSPPLAPSTIYIYSSVAKRFILGLPKVKDVTKQLLDLDTYNQFLYDHAIKKRSTYCYDALKLYIKWKFDKDPRVQSVLRNLQKPRIQSPKKVTKYLDYNTRLEIVGLLKKHKHRVMALIQLITGVRAGDVLRLRHNAVTFEAYNADGKDCLVLMLHFEGKGKQFFIKPIFDPIIQETVELYAKKILLDQEYLFLERRPNVSFILNFKNNYNKYLVDLKQAATFYGINYSDWATHDFRRTFAQDVYSKWGDVVQLKDVLNHKQLETTIRYLRNSGLGVRDTYYKMSEVNHH